MPNSSIPAAGEAVPLHNIDPSEFSIGALSTLSRVFDRYSDQLRDELDRRPFVKDSAAYPNGIVVDLTSAGAAFDAVAEWLDTQRRLIVTELRNRRPAEADEVEIRAFTLCRELTDFGKMREVAAVAMAAQDGRCEAIALDT